jgi:hypothetical protein
MSPGKGLTANDDEVKGRRLQAPCHSLLVLIVGTQFDVPMYKDVELRNPSHQLIPLSGLLQIDRLWHFGIEQAELACRRVPNVRREANIWTR